MIGIYLYSALIIIGVTLLGLSYWRTKNKLVFILFLALSGCIAIFDYAIYVWGIAYVYKPGFLGTEMDKQLGAMVSDFFSVPAFAVFIVAFRLKWFWAVAIDLLYYGIEELFIKVDIYEQFWWKTWYTFALLLPLFWISKVWYDKLNHPHKRALSYLTLISALLTVKLMPILLFSGIFEIRKVISEWIKSLGTQGPVINVPICLATTVVFTFIIMHKAKKVWMAVAILIFFLFELLLRKLYIVQSKNFWDYIFIVSLDIITMISGIYFGKLLQPGNATNE